jgi:hypothetical protein
MAFSVCENGIVSEKIDISAGFQTFEKPIKKWLENASSVFQAIFRFR